MTDSCKSPEFVASTSNDDNVTETLDYPEPDLSAGLLSPGSLKREVLSPLPVRGTTPTGPEEALPHSSPSERLEWVDEEVRRNDINVLMASGDTPPPGPITLGESRSPRPGTPKKATPGTTRSRDVSTPMDIPMSPGRMTARDYDEVDEQSWNRKRRRRDLETRPLAPVLCEGERPEALILVEKGKEGDTPSPTMAERAPSVLNEEQNPNERGSHFISGGSTEMLQ